MGLFSKMPSSSATAQARANLADDFEAAERASEERSTRFWRNHGQDNNEDPNPS